MRHYLLGLALSSMAGVALANDLESDKTGWIVGGGIGKARLSVKPVDQGADFNETANVYTAFGGYNYTDWLGIEFDIIQSSDITDSNTNLDAYVIGTSVSPKFTLHFNDNTSVYLKLGAQYLSYEQDVDESLRSRTSWTGTDVFLGIGGQYSFDSGIRVRLDAKHARMELESDDYRGFFRFDEEDLDLDLSVLTFSAYYQF